MHPIILPTGTEDRWKYAHDAADPAVWDELANEMLHAAARECDTRLKDDILVLSMVACCRADDCDKAVPFSLDAPAAKVTMEVAV